MSEWLNDLSEDHQANESLKAFKDVGALAQGFLDTKKLQGSSIRIDGSEMDDAQRLENFKRIQKHIPTAILLPDPDKSWKEQPDEFKSLFGIPEAKDGYTPSTEFKGLPEDLLESITNMADHAGLNRKQFEAMADFAAENHASTQGQLDEYIENNTKAIKARLGLAFDDDTKGIELLAKQYEDEVHPIDMDDPSVKAAMNVPAIKLLLNNIRKNALSGTAGNGLLVAEGEGKMTPAEHDVAWTDMLRSQVNKDYMAGRLPADQRKAHQLKRHNMRLERMGEQV